MLRIKFFGNVKKHARRNVSADALYVCTIVMPGKAIWRLQNARNRSAPDPAERAYSAPSDPLADGEGAGCPLPKIPTPLSAFQASPVPTPYFSPPPTN